VTTRPVAASAVGSPCPLDDDLFDEDLDPLGEKPATVIRALGDRSRIAYEYDFDDGWDHEVVIDGRPTLTCGLSTPCASMVPVRTLRRTAAAPAATRSCSSPWLIRATSTTSISSNGSAPARSDRVRH
jgi:hypothetical protein